MEIRVNGEVVYELDERVLAASVVTKQGEQAQFGLEQVHQWIDIIVVSESVFTPSDRIDTIEPVPEDYADEFDDDAEDDMVDPSNDD